jgi:flagellar basal-body rod modification protein FlgD
MQIPAHHATTSPFAPHPAAVPAATGNNSTSGSSSSSSSSSTSTATITANDFLQLLVTELQNQDPTADTDPNEYVDQLVQVNSLQQLIQMNQTLDGGPTLTGASSGVLQELNQMNETLDGDVAGSSGSAEERSAVGKTHAAASMGNLSPVANAKVQAAAKQVASALAPKANPALSGGPAQAFEEFAARLKAQGK